MDTVSGRAAVNLLRETMRLEEEIADQPQERVVRHPAPAVKGSGQVRPQLLQLYGYVLPDQKDQFVGLVKARKLANSQILTEGAYTWVGESEWSKTLTEWIVEHKIENIQQGTVKGETLTARIGAPVEPALHDAVRAKCAITNATVQDLIYIITEHFVVDVEFRTALVDASIARRIAAVQAAMGNIR